MNVTAVQTTFFFALLLGALALVAGMLLPFFNVIALSAVLALAFQPLFQWFRAKATRGHGAPASLLTIVVIFVLVAGPLTFVGARVFQESTSVYAAIDQGGFGFAEAIDRFVGAPLRAFAPDFQIDVRAYAASVFGYLGTHAGTLVSGAVSVVGSLVLILITTFFFLKDGPDLVAKMRRLSPLDRDDEDALIKKIVAAVKAVVHGVVLVCAVQGLLVGIGLAIFGVPNATLWGFLAAILAVVPVLGTGLVTLPAMVYLLATGSVGAAIGLAVWSFALVSMVDNFLAPYFYSRGIQIHQIFMLFAVLGGISFFGPLGFIYGPVALALFVALASVYRSRFLA